jgi:hypothetical protein
MHRNVLIHCLPWLGLLIASLVILRWLIVVSGARLHLERLRQLHRDQVGSVQSLSFVLTLPIFIMFMLLIVQSTQLMIGQVMVEYAAIAAARAAMVWVPAAFSADGTDTNCQSDAKLDKIRSAAVLACLPIAPSRSVSQSLPAQGQSSFAARALPALQAAYLAIAPQSAGNSRISTRIANKLAYSLNNTGVQLQFVHRNGEPALQPWFVGPDLAEFRPNEIGWQDELQLTVFHRLALLPGPGRLLFSRAASPNGAPDQVSGDIQSQGADLYTYTLTASASMGMEGEKSVLTYVYQQ